jgi:hypothetical protein
MHTSKIYDLRVCSEWPLPGAAVAGGEPDVVFRRAGPSQPRPFQLRNASRVYQNPSPAADGRGTLEVHREGMHLCLHCRGFAEFFLADGKDVLCFPGEGTPAEAVAALLLGPVCALLLELRGIPCLHASAVRVGDSAVALTAAAGTGKSSLAAWLVHHGHALVSDDILPLAPGGSRCLATPGYPQMNLSPHVLGQVASGAAVMPGVAGADKCRVPVGRGWGTFADGPLPLARVYVLERQSADETGVRLEPLRASEGLVELLRWSFCARLVEALGLQARRLAILAQVTRQTPVRRLHYPSGLGQLDAVRDAILRDMR